MEGVFFKEICLIFGLAIAVLLISHRFKIPTIVGFLITGVLAGPNGLKLVESATQVEVLSELGVILLLFTIGIEFSIENLLRIRRSVLLGGGLQVAFTIILVYLLSRYFLELNFASSLFLGFAISLSSTTVVLKLLQEKALVESPHGTTSLAILIFQDIVAVLMMFMIPYLAGVGSPSQGSFVPFLVKGLAFLFLVLVCGKWVVPKLLYLIAGTRSRELFLLSIIVICFAVASLTQALGLSLALGAFLAGLIISRTEFSHETLGHVIPFRDVFVSLFFISIGMLLELGFVVSHPGQILLLTLILMTLKAILVVSVVFFLGYPLRTCLLTGIFLCQIGEFSFVLLLKGVALGLLDREYYQLLLNVSVLSMAVTPFVFSLAPRFVEASLRLPLPSLVKVGLYGGKDSAELIVKKTKLKDHLIIVGFGLNGRNISRAARFCGIDYIVLETNPETVREERRKGEPIFYGDASHEAVLEQAGVKKARTIVVVISDPIATRRIILLARRNNPAIHIIARTRFLSEMERLYELGADEVIPEEFETSIEIFARVLASYHVPSGEIERLIGEVRSEGYRMFRTFSGTYLPFPDLKALIPDLSIGTLQVDVDAPAAGKSLDAIGLRKDYGVTLLAVKKGNQVQSNPSGETVLEGGDILFVLGDSEKFAAVKELFARKKEQERHESDISSSDRDDL